MKSISDSKFCLVFIFYELEILDEDNFHAGIGEAFLGSGDAELIFRDFSSDNIFYRLKTCHNYEYPSYKINPPTLYVKQTGLNCTDCVYSLQGQAHSNRIAKFAKQSLQTVFGYFRPKPNSEEVIKVLSCFSK